MWNVCTGAAWGFWGVAIAWFLGMILCLRQRVTIKIDSSYLETKRGENTVIVKGKIKARHKECFDKFNLSLSGVDYPQQIRGHYPDSMDSTFHKFYAAFAVPPKALDKSDDAYLTAVFPNGEKDSEVFKIRPEE